MIDGVPEPAGLLLAGWASAHGIERAHRADEVLARQEPSSSGWS